MLVCVGLRWRLSLLLVTISSTSQLLLTMEYFLVCTHFIWCDKFFRRVNCLLILSATSFILHIFFLVPLNSFRSYLVQSWYAQSLFLIISLLSDVVGSGIFTQATGRMTHRGYSVLPRVRGHYHIDIRCLYRFNYDGSPDILACDLWDSI